MPHYDHGTEQGVTEMMWESKEQAESKAREFWRDLMGVLYGNPEYRGNSGIMSAAHIADLMNTTEERVTPLLWECVYMGLSDRSCGLFVV